MHRTDQDWTEDNPEQGRDPAPDYTDGRPDNGAGAGDGSEMVPEKDILAGWDKVLCITELPGWSWLCVPQLEDFLAQISTISVVGNYIQGTTTDGKME